MFLRLITLLYLLISNAAIVQAEVVKLPIEPDYERDGKTDPRYFLALLENQKTKKIQPTWIIWNNNFCYIDLNGNGSFHDSDERFPQRYFTGNDVGKGAQFVQIKDKEGKVIHDKITFYYEMGDEEMSFEFNLDQTLPFYAGLLASQKPQDIQPTYFGRNLQLLLKEKTLSPQRNQVNISIASRHPTARPAHLTFMKKYNGGIQVIPDDLYINATVSVPDADGKISVTTMAIKDKCWGIYFHDYVLVNQMAGKTVSIRFQVSTAIQELPITPLEIKEIEVLVP